MNNISIELAKLDIKVRDYLNVKRYFKSPRFIMEEIKLIQKKIPYFWLNASTIVTGYIIETIDGEIYKPVIGIKQLSLKRRIHFHLKEEILERIRKKYLFNIVCCLSTKTNLPQDVMKYILKYTDLISQSNINE
tara:strand:+ start:1042 stop:1443 length:402 start_codon:yes stop_codon:yes gene_type:complete